MSPAGSNNSTRPAILSHTVSDDLEKVKLKGRGRYCNRHDSADNQS
jgi:hypothetical protein